MNTSEGKACPFCGQLVVGTDEICKPEEYCNCSGAVQWRTDTEVYEKMKEGLCELFGEGCDDIEPSFKAIADEDIEMIAGFIEPVAYHRVRSCSLSLKDGSVCGIRYGEITRKVTAKGRR